MLYDFRLCLSRILCFFDNPMNFVSGKIWDHDDKCNRACKKCILIRGFSFALICDHIGRHSGFFEIWHTTDRFFVICSKGRVNDKNLTTKIGHYKFDRKRYLQSFKNISAPTASRDLKWAVEQGILRKPGAQRMTTYQYF